VAKQTLVESLLPTPGLSLEKCRSNKIFSPGTTFAIFPFSPFGRKFFQEKSSNPEENFLSQEL
jgi:hypothetical protein